LGGRFGRALVCLVLCLIEKKGNNMFTNLAMVIYLSDVVSGLKDLFLFISLSGGMGLVVLTAHLLIEEEMKNHKKKYAFTILLYFFIVFVYIITPTKNTIYLLIGGVAMDKGAEEIAKSKYPKELQKTFDNLLNKINKELESDTDK
jgi:hypothetical protein